MQIEININNYPEVKENLTNQLKKKFSKKNPSEKLDVSQITFYYSYCVRIDNVKYDDVMDHIKNKIGGCYYGKFGRFIVNCDGDYPQELIDSVSEGFNKVKNQENTKQKQEQFLTSVLLKVGKTPNFKKEERPGVMNGTEFLKFMMSNIGKQPIIFPTIDDLKIAEPTIYQKYLNLSGKQLVTFNPGHELSDEYGFMTKNVIGAYFKDKANTKIIVCEDEYGTHSQVQYSIQVYDLHDEEPDTVYWKFNQTHQPVTTKFFSTTPGADFKSNHGGTYHRMTDSEVHSLLTRIFNHNVDIQRKSNPGVTNHGNGLFQISF